MSNDTPQEDKTEEPSSKRRDEFRERGEVAKSPELTSAAMLAAGAGALVMTAGFASDRLAGVFGATLGRLEHSERLIEDPGSALEPLAEGFLSILPGMGLLAVVAIAVNLAQVGPLLSAKALQPKFGRLNPVSGIKRLFLSKDTLVNLALNLAKVVLLGTVAGLTLLGFAADLNGLVSAPVSSLGEMILKITVYPFFTASMTMFVLGGLHFAYQKHRMHGRMKMTREEAKREHRESEGDPMMKGRRRAKAREILNMNKMIEAVPTATVVVTNPTHYAVALRYDATIGVPIVVAKGVDARAAKIREAATANDVPLVENVPLARGLYAEVELNQGIPENFFRAVAEVLAFVMQRKRKGSLITRN